MICSFHSEPAAVPARPRDLIQARSVRGFRFTESLHRGIIPAHAHKLATVTVLLEGTYKESYSLSTKSCEEESILYRPAAEVHADQIGECGARLFVIEVEEDRARSVEEYSNILNEVVYQEDKHLMGLVCQMRNELTATDEASSLALEGMMMTFMARSIRLQSAGSKQTNPVHWLTRCEELMRDRFREDAILLSELAEEVGVHPVHFARAFKSHYGVSPGHFLRTLRIEWAADQLRTTKLPLADIALAAGFSDQSHFGRVFKRHYSVSPGYWRRQHRT